MDFFTTLQRTYSRTLNTRLSRGIPMSLDNTPPILWSGAAWGSNFMMDMAMACLLELLCQGLMALHWHASSMLACLPTWLWIQNKKCFNYRTPLSSSFLVCLSTTTSTANFQLGAIGYLVGQCRIHFTIRMGFHEFPPTIQPIPTWSSDMKTLCRRGKAGNN